MSRSNIILLAVGVLVVIIGGSAISSYNTFVSLEERLKAQHTQTQNVYASISNDIQSQGLAVDRYQQAVMQALEAAMTGRYGETGVDAALTAIREQNPTMSPQIFGKLQDVISASYRRFERAQAVKLDIVREYETALRRFPSNMTASLFGFPQENLDEMKQIVLNEATYDAFDKKSAGPIDPFAK